jgi:hypothetical protein
LRIVWAVDSVRDVCRIPILRSLRRETITMMCAGVRMITNSALRAQNRVTNVACDMI